jgi:mannosyltransferase OCH1-like enzyme
MILSYSLDVRHVPLHILFLNFMFSYLNFIIVDFFSLSCNPDSGIEEGQRRHVNINRLKNKHHIAILKKLRQNLNACVSVSATLLDT